MEESLPSTSKSVQSVTSPEYFSCEETDDFKELFQSKLTYEEEEKFLSIDYYLKDGIDYTHFDSDLTIAAFHGCLRIGKVITNSLLNETEPGLNKDNLIEIPLFFIPKFINDLLICIAFLLNNKLSLKKDVIETTVGEIHHKVFLYTKRIQVNNERHVVFYVKKNNSVVYELCFYQTIQLKDFSQKLFTLILDTTYPKPYQQEYAILLLNKLSNKPDNTIATLFSYWEKKQKLDILWNAISEIVFEKKQKAEKTLTILIFNFIKKHIFLINAMQKLHKLANIK